MTPRHYHMLLAALFIFLFVLLNLFAWLAYWHHEGAWHFA